MSTPPRYDDVYMDGIDQWEAEIVKDMGSPQTGLFRVEIPLPQRPSLTDKQALDLALAVIQEVDYDIWKDYQPDTAEMPEDVPDMRQALVNAVQKYLAGEESR